jgi:hypothetical protein
LPQASNSQESEQDDNNKSTSNKKTKFFGKSNNDDDDNTLGMDTVTLIWYLTTFTALFGFFIVMACTENKCNGRRASKPEETRNATPSPCPSYKHFAPPSYGSVMKKLKDQKIYIVPVHEQNNNFFNNNSSPSTTDPNSHQTNIDIEKNETTSVER